MFVRIKSIKGKDYAYMVRNVWRKRKKGSRQKVAGYLGRVYRFENIYSKSFNEFYRIEDLESYVKNKGKKEVINDLIRLELVNRGFKEEGEKLVNGKLAFDMEKLAFFVSDKKAKAVIEMNEGFLCKETISRLVNFKSELEEEREGYDLANAFVEAGLSVPQEVFVEYYRVFFG